MGVIRSGWAIQFGLDPRRKAVQVPAECPPGMTAVAPLTTDGPEASGYCVDTDTSIPPSNNFQAIVDVCEARGASLCSSDAYNAAASKLLFDGCIVTPTNENNCNPQIYWAVSSDACASGHYLFNYANTGDLNNGLPYPNYQLCSSTYKFSNRYFRCCGGRVQMPKTELTCDAGMTPIYDGGFCIDSVGHASKSLSSMADVDQACADRGLQLCSANQMAPVARYFDYLLPNKGYGWGNTGGWGIICDSEASGKVNACTGAGRNIFQYQNVHGYQAVNGLCTADYGTSQHGKANRYYRCCTGSGTCGETKVWKTTEVNGYCVDGQGRLFDGYKKDGQTLDACQTLCASLPQCVSITYVARKTRCIIHTANEVPSRAPEGGWDKVKDHQSGEGKSFFPEEANKFKDAQCYILTTKRV